MNRQSISIVLLPTLECNCSCEYCYEHHRGGRWSIHDTVAVLDSVFAFLHGSGISSLRLNWQGGEPLLLSDDFWEQVLHYARHLSEKYSISLIQRMQTNLILYRSSLKDIFHQYFCGIIGSSFELYSERNTGKDGVTFEDMWKKSYDRAGEDGIEVGVLSLLNESVFCKGALEYLDILRNNWNIRKIRFTLPFITASGRGYWVDPEKAGKFLGDVFEIWYHNGQNSWMEIKPFAGLTETMMAGQPREGSCRFSANCSNVSLSVSTDGTVSLCDNFSEDPSKTYGNIFTVSLSQIVKSEGYRKIHASIPMQKPDECFVCPYLSVCQGGCAVRTVMDGKTGNYNYIYCRTYKILFSRMEEVLGIG